jgi:hypothetical protein
MLRRRRLQRRRPLQRLLTAARLAAAPAPWHGCVQGPACIETICVLVELGSDVGALLAHRPMETPLHIAARCGRADVVDRLLKCPQVGSSHRHLAREASA